MSIRITKINKKKKVLKEKSYKTNDEEFTDFLRDSIDFTDYDSFMSIKNPFLRGFKTFLSEKKYEIERGSNIFKVFSEYLSGLPGWLDIPFYFVDIRNLLYSLGYDEIRSKRFEDNDKLVSFYYNKIYEIFIKNS